MVRSINYYTILLPSARGCTARRSPWA